MDVLQLYSPHFIKAITDNTHNFIYFYGTTTIKKVVIRI